MMTEEVVEKLFEVDLNEYMQACYLDQHAEGTSQVQFKRNVINTRTAVERAFGRLKGWWPFCNSSCHQNDPELVTVAIVVCCCIHNYLESRNVGIDDDVKHNLWYSLSYSL